MSLPGHSYVSADFMRLKPSLARDLDISDSGSSYAGRGCADQSDQELFAMLQSTKVLNK
jgi:hypothetical protein